MEESEVMDLKEYFQVLGKRWWMILITFIIFVTGSGIISYFVLDPMYEAKTTLFVGKEKQDIRQPLQYNDIMVNQQLAKDYSVLAKSEVVTQAVIDKMKLSTSAEELAKNIQVNIQEETRIIEMKVSSTDAALAKNIANTLTVIFINKAKEIIKVQNIQVVDKAKIPRFPVKPKPILNMTIAGVAAMMISVGIILLVEYLDDTIKTPEDIEKHLGLIAIGAIPMVKK